MSKAMTSERRAELRRMSTDYGYHWFGVPYKERELREALAELLDATEPDAEPQES